MWLIFDDYYTDVEISLLSPDEGLGLFCVLGQEWKKDENVNIYNKLLEKYELNFPIYIGDLGASTPKKLIDNGVMT